MEVKKCKFCQKEVLNLAAHIIRVHPAVYEQLEETPPLAPQTPHTPPISQNLPVQNARIGLSINEMIREKLDTMLNIKIIEMLSQNPKTTLQEVAQITNPTPQKSTIETLRELKEMQSILSPPELPQIETGNQTLDVIQQALPIIREMLPARKQEIKKNMESVENVSRENQTVRRTIKPIQLKITGDTGEPRSFEPKPSIDSGAEQQNDTSVKPIN